MKVWLQRLAIAAAALGLVLLCARLGLWQLQRASDKQALAQQMHQRGNLAPQALEAWLAPEQVDGVPGGDPPPEWLEAHRYRPVTLAGRWLREHTVFLDNRQMRQRPGFFAVTPLQLESGRGVVLVQRGWAPRDFHDRTRVPLLEPDGADAVVTLVGTLEPPPSRLMELSATAEPGQDANAHRVSRIRQNIELADFARDTGLPLFSTFTIRQTSDASDGLLRDWPVVDVGVEKHHGYAFQWFALAALVVVLYVWFQVIRPLRRPVHE